MHVFMTSKSNHIVDGHSPGMRPDFLRWKTTTLTVQRLSSEPWQTIHTLLPVAETNFAQRTCTRGQLWWPQNVIIITID
jgi:hypothetical protein